MKTPIQELIEQLETIKNTKCKTLQETIFFDGVLAIIDSGDYIEKEKDMVIEAFANGRLRESPTNYIEAEDYYNETYNK